MNKKVAFVISSLGGGGAERVLTNVANQMIKDGLSVKVIKTGTKENHDYFLSEKIQIIQVPKTKGNIVKRAVQMLHYMRKIFSDNKDYTIVSFLSDNNMLSLIASVGLKNRVIVCERNDPNQNCGNELLRQIRNKIYLLADWSVFQTEDAKTYFSKRIQDKSSVIPNPIVLEDYKLNYVTEVKNIIVAAGRLTEQKNYPMLIKAFSGFSKTHPDYILKIYGEGPLHNEIEKLIISEGLRGKVILCGYTDKLYEPMKEARMYVSSSNYEGISNTMLEAMALSVPTIVTDCPIGGARLVITNMKNGIIVPVGDSNRLCEAMSKVADDMSLNKTLRNNSNKIIDKYNIQNITMQWESIL